MFNYYSNKNLKRNVRYMEDIYIDFRFGNAVFFIKIYKNEEEKIKI